MPKGESMATGRAAGENESDARFSAWFRQVMEKRNGPESGG
ncbi:MAG: hypothetical protein L0H75_08865 [Nitrosospira sp.]|nr:hypothetical protein [Nitrosospira sp.]